MARRDTIGIASLLIAFVVVGGGVYLMYLNWQARQIDPAIVAQAALGEARQYANGGNFYAALESLTEALDHDPDLVDANRLRGEILLMIDDPRSAAIDLTIAIEQGHDNATTRLLRGKAWRDMERFDDAIAEFARVVELDPTNREVRGVRGKLLLDLGRYEEARDMLRSQLKLVPSDAGAWKRLGWSMWGLGRYDDAVGPLTRAMEEQPYNFHSQFGRGMTHIFRREFEAALADLDAVCTNPEFTSEALPHLHRFVTRWRFGDRDRALADLQQIQTGRGDRRGVGGTHLLWSNSIAQFLAGDLAESEFFEFIEETGNTPDPEIAVEGWYFAGMVRLLNGDRDGAIELLNRAVDTEVYTEYEYHAAVAELKSMELAESQPEPDTDGRP